MSLLAKLDIFKKGPIWAPVLTNQKRFYKGLVDNTFIVKDPKMQQTYDPSANYHVKRIDQGRLAQIKGFGSHSKNPFNPNVRESNIKMNRRIGKGTKAGWHPSPKILFTKDVDFVRCDKKVNTMFVEKILEIKLDDTMTGFIALVAGNYPLATKRWIICPHAVNVGDILATHADPTSLKMQNLDELKQGDAYPLKFIPTGQAVCLISIKNFQDGRYSKIHAKQAGAHLFVIKNDPLNNETTLYSPASKRMTKMNDDEIATIGRVSNIEHKHKSKKPKSNHEEHYLGMKYKGKRYSMPDIRHMRSGPRYGCKTRIPRQYVPVVNISGDDVTPYTQFDKGPLNILRPYIPKEGVLTMTLDEYVNQAMEKKRVKEFEMNEGNESEFENKENQIDSELENEQARSELI